MCLAEPVTRIASRLFKRITGDDVTVADYDEMWAEINVDGSVVHNSKTDTPAHRIHASRISPDLWAVKTESRMLMPIESVSYLQRVAEQHGLGGMPTCQFYYTVDKGSEQTMTTDEVLALMAQNDPDIRNESQHYSRALANE